MMPFRPALPSKLPAPASKLKEMRLRFAIAAICLTSLCALAQKQSNPYAPPPPPPNAPSTQPSKDCSWGASRGDKGPWKSTSNCEQSTSDTNAPPPLVPDNKSAQQKQQTPAQANPFPEAQSQKAQDAANAASSKPAQGVSSSHVDLDRLNAPAGSASRISNGEGGYIHDPTLAKHDEKVGGFYLQNGDYKGAYDRFLEATRVAPEDGDAVFGLAQAAQGLHRNNEAETNYNIYLDAFPKGKKAKDARKALAELGSGPREKTSGTSK